MDAKVENARHLTVAILDGSDCILFSFKFETKLNAALTKKISSEEVWLALGKNMQPSKAPSPDVFSLCFY